VRIRKIVEVDFSLRRRNGTASPDTRLRAHLRLRVCPPYARPLPLQRATLLRVISFARTRPQRSWLLRRQAPGRVRIRIAVHGPARTPPPAAARNPAEGSFTGASPSVGVPGGRRSQSGVPGLPFSRFSAESPGRVFAPLSATGLGFRKARDSP